MEGLGSGSHGSRDERGQHTFLCGSLVLRSFFHGQEVAVIVSRAIALADSRYLSSTHTFVATFFGEHHLFDLHPDV